MGRRKYQAPVGGYQPDPRRISGNRRVDFDSAGTQSDKYVPKRKGDPVREAGGMTGSVKALDERRGLKETVELSSEEEFAAMWKLVNDMAYAGGYNITFVRSQIKEELRRMQADGLRLAAFGSGEAGALIRRFIKPAAPKPVPKPRPEPVPASAPNSELEPEPEPKSKAELAVDRALGYMDDYEIDDEVKRRVVAEIQRWFDNGFDVEIYPHRLEEMVEEAEEDIRLDQELEDFWPRVQELARREDFDLGSFEDLLRSNLEKLQGTGRSLEDVSDEELEGVMHAMEVALEIFEQLFKKIYNPEDESEVFKEGFRLFVNYLEENRDVDAIDDIQFIADIVMEAEKNLYHERGGEDLEPVADVKFEDMTAESLFGSDLEAVRNWAPQAIEDLNKMLENVRSYPEIVEKIDDVLKRVQDFFIEHQDTLKEVEGEDDLVGYYINKALIHALSGQMHLSGELRIEDIKFPLFKIAEVLDQYFDGVGLRQLADLQSEIREHVNKIGL